MVTGRLESITEDMCIDTLRRLGYYDDSDIKVDRQTCSNKEINKLFEHASKNGTGRWGYPDFIITSNKYKDTVILIECKSDGQKQAEEDVAHYAKYTYTAGYNTVLIAASGISMGNLEISTGYVCGREDSEGRHLELRGEGAILTFDDFAEHFECCKYWSRDIVTDYDIKEVMAEYIVQKIKEDKSIGKAREMHLYKKNCGDLKITDIFDIKSELNHTMSSGLLVRNGCIQYCSEGMKLKVGDVGLTIKDIGHKNIYVYIFMSTILNKWAKNNNIYQSFSIEKRMSNAAAKISVPIKDGKPDYKFMEEYIKSLPYSIVLDKVSNDN